MTTITPEHTIGELVAADPRRARIFERLGMDYCCGGKRPLAEACAERGLDAATVVQMIAAATDAANEDAATNWQDAALGDLIHHIETTHHAYLRRELPRLESLLQNVSRAHGDRASWILTAADVFDGLESDLLDHIEKEEQTVFPFIRALEQNRLTTTPGALGPDPVRLMEDEHEAAGKALARLRDLTDNFTPPEWACNSLRAVLSGLAQLEADTHQHVHKENNIFFERARTLA